MKKKPKVLIVMGVTACGKTTLSKRLAEQLEVPFFDGDDFHSKASIRKMTEGIPLQDEDRWSWLRNINELALTQERVGPGAVIACSALKHKYREVLNEGLEKETLLYVYLKAEMHTIAERLRQRKDHFMNASLLDSQFQALEEPKADRDRTLVLDAAKAIEANLTSVLEYLKERIE